MAGNTTPPDGSTKVLEGGRTYEKPVGRNQQQKRPHLHAKSGEKFEAEWLAAFLSVQ
jgi:hypothetical protein